MNLAKMLTNRSNTRRKQRRMISSCIIQRRIFILRHIITIVMMMMMILSFNDCIHPVHSFILDAFNPKPCKKIDSSCKKSKNILAWYTLKAVPGKKSLGENCSLHQASFILKITTVSGKLFKTFGTLCGGYIQCYHYRYRSSLK